MGQGGRCTYGNYKITGPERSDGGWGFTCAQRFKWVFCSERISTVGVQNLANPLSPVPLGGSPPQALSQIFTPISHGTLTAAHSTLTATHGTLTALSMLVKDSHGTLTALLPPPANRPDPPPERSPAQGGSLDPAHPRSPFQRKSFKLRTPP